MELTYRLIALENLDNQYPFARVLITPIDPSAPELIDKFPPRITVEVPVVDPGGSLPELAQQAIRSAQALVDSAAGARWLASVQA